MIVYKIDQQPQAKASSQIRDMNEVLSEIAPTLETLQKLLNQLQASVSIPSLNASQTDLQNLINDAIRLMRYIAPQAQKVAFLGEEAGKQLASLDMQVHSALTTNTAKTQPTQEVQATNYDQKKAVAVQHIVPKNS